MANFYHCNGLGLSWIDGLNLKPRGLVLQPCLVLNVLDTFDELETILTKYNVKDKPHCIYNIDEKGLSAEHTPPKVYGDSDAQPPAATAVPDNTTTIISAGNAV